MTCDVIAELSDSDPKRHPAYFVGQTNPLKSLLQSATMGYYKVQQGLLQSATGITKCDVITKCDSTSCNSSNLQRSNRL